jgi:hypothetical protein
VLFDRRHLEGLADGSITCTFRRWSTRQAIAGRRYRTPVGIIEVDDVRTLEPAAITDVDAGRSGYASARDLVADLRGDPSLPITRVAFHLVDEPDPREVLARDDALSTDDVEAIAARLRRIDARSADGPWTRQTLELIRERPAVRAADLAAATGRETTVFKRRVRSLKELGLTRSLEVGYRLSPRGEAFVRAGER